MEEASVFYFDLRILAGVWSDLLGHKFLEFPHGLYF
jgi:hypothetical protein